MATLTIGQATHHNALHTYFQNVGKAGRTFIAALLAFEFAPPVAKVQAQEKAVEVAQENVQGQISMLSLYRLASQTDSVRPDLVDEIRLLAARESMKRRRLV